MYSPWEFVLNDFLKALMPFSSNISHVSVVHLLSISFMQHVQCKQIK